LFCKVTVSDFSENRGKKLLSPNKKKRLNGKKKNVTWKGLFRVFAWETVVDLPTTACKFVARKKEKNNFSQKSAQYVRAS
jgi:hypothetical protein